MRTKKLYIMILSSLILWGMLSCSSRNYSSSSGGSSGDDLYATESYQKPAKSANTNTTYVTPQPVPANGSTSVEEYYFSSSEQGMYAVDSSDEHYISAGYMEKMSARTQGQKSKNRNSYMGPSTGFGVSSGSYNGMPYQSWNVTYGFSNGPMYGPSPGYYSNAMSGWNPTYGYSGYSNSCAYTWNSYPYNTYPSYYDPYYDPYYYGGYSYYPAYGGYYGNSYYYPYSAPYFDPFSSQPYYNYGSYNPAPPVNNGNSSGGNGAGNTNTNPRNGAPGGSYHNNTQNQYSHPDYNNYNYGGNNGYDSHDSGSYQNNPRPSSPGSSYSSGGGSDYDSYGGSSGGANPRTSGGGSGGNTNRTYQPIRR